MRGRVKCVIACILLLCMLPTGGLTLAAETEEQLLFMDFNSYAEGETPSGLVNCEVTKYEGSNALKVKADTYGTTVKMDEFIMGEYCLSFDIAAPSADFDGTINVASGGSRRRTLVSFNKGMICAGNNKQVGKVSKKYQHITVCVNPAKKYFDLYVNGKRMFSKAYFDALSDKCMSVIFKFTAAEATDVYLDNMLLHSTQVKTDRCFVYNPYGYIEEKKEITYTPESDRIYYKTFGTYTQTMSILKDKTAIHMKSGVVYANGEKYRLEVMPFEENGEYMVPAKAVEDLLATKVSETGGSITVGDDVRLTVGKTSMQLANSSAELAAAPTIKDGVLFLPLRAIAERGFSKVVFHDDTAVSSGMVIISATRFNPPDNADKMQVLNNYLFYIRPTWEDILEDYKQSASYQVHPRVMMTPDTVAQLKKDVQTNDIKKSWYNRLIEYSDKIIGYDTLRYELRDGVRLMYVSSDFESYMLCLGMAYQLTGDKKYADAAWKHIEAVANFPDWNPSHPIDVGIMGVGFAVAYDWMYDCWTDEQKGIMEKGVLNNCFYVASETYKGSSKSMDGVINAQNFNCICNGGISMTALAFMDVNPELSARLTSEAVRCLEYMIPNFAPHGMWYEGPSYAAMTINYTVKMLSTLESALGNLYCLDETEGFDKAAEFLSYCQSDVGCYNFGDAEQGAATTPGLFWLFKHFNIQNMKDTVATSRRYVSNYDSTLVDSLLWYSTEEESGAAEQFLDKYYDGDDLVTMRNNYNSGQVFVGLKGGDPSRAHEHLDAGSFIFDAMGVRWAYDMGKDDYNLPGYNGNDLALRYKIFRLRAASHNTLIINPTEEPEYEIGERAAMTEYESKPRGVKAVIDMSKMQAKNASSATRGFLFADDRTSLVIRDEVTVPKTSDIYWYMYTKAKVEVSGNTVTLTDTTDSAKQVQLEFVSNLAGQAYVEAASPLESAPVVAGQNSNKDFQRIVYKVQGSGSVNITAKLTPTAYGGSSVEDYDMPIREWSVADGEMEPIPILDTLTIGGVSYDTEERFLTISCENEESPVPEIQAESSRYNVEIIRGETVSDKSYILLTDPENPESQCRYTISFNPQRIKRVIEGYDVVEIKTVTATDEPQPDNIAINVLDGKPATRWSAEREQSLLLELENEAEIDTYLMSMYSGQTRKTFFDVYVSADGTTFEKVYSGATSGTTSDYEAYDIGKHKVKYIRVDFHGASNSTWNSVTEIVAALKK